MRGVPATDGGCCLYKQHSNGRRQLCAAYLWGRQVRDLGVWRGFLSVARVNNVQLDLHKLRVVW